MDYKAIILTLGIIAALMRLVKVRNTVSTLIVFIQIISVVLTLIGDSTIVYYVFGSAILFALLYPFVNKEKDQAIGKWMWIWLFLIPTLLAFVFGIFNFPGYGIIRLSMIISLAIFFYAMFNRDKFKYEIGFMILFAADALVRLIVFFI